MYFLRKSLKCDFVFILFVKLLYEFFTANVCHLALSIVVYCKMSFVVGEAALRHLESLVAKTDVELFGNVELKRHDAFEKDYVSHVYFATFECDWSLYILLSNFWTCFNQTNNLVEVARDPGIY